MIHKIRLEKIAQRYFVMSMFREPWATPGKFCKQPSSFLRDLLFHNTLPLFPTSWGRYSGPLHELRSRKLFLSLTCNIPPE